MKKICYIILLLSVIFSLSRCDKEPAQEISQPQERYTVSDEFVSDVLAEMERRGTNEDIKNNFLNSLNVITTRSKTPFSTSGFAPATQLNECDSLIINPIETASLVNLNTKILSNEVCQYRIYSDLRLDPNVEIVQTIRANGDIYNYFFDILSLCEVYNSNPSGTWKFVNEGQSNISPAQIEVQEIYENEFTFVFPGVPFPLHSIRVINPDYVLALSRNLDHQLMGFPYVGSFGSISGIPLHYVVEKSKVNVGQKLEFLYQ